MIRHIKFMASLVLVATCSIVGINQAYALNDDEAAVLMGLAVGGITAYAVKHHREHDRNDWRAKPVHQSGGHSNSHHQRDWGRPGHQANDHSSHHQRKLVIIHNSRDRWYRPQHHQRQWQGHRHGHGHRHGPHCGKMRW